MGFLDRVKGGAAQAAARAKEEVKEVQTKRELGQAYGELGKTAFDLIERGELSHAELSVGAERIRGLKAQLEAEEGPAGPTPTTEPEPPASTEPPAMPS